MTFPTGVPKDSRPAMTLGGLPAEPQSQRLSGAAKFFFRWREWRFQRSWRSNDADIHWVCAFGAGAAWILLGVRKWVYQILIYPIL